MENKILNSLQLGMLFLNGFLISRIFIKCGIAEKTVFFFIRKSKGQLSRILFLLLMTTAGVSMFIPNMIAILAVLPILEILKKDFDKIDNQNQSINTSLAASSLYGANLGGTGSISGSPSNLILIGFLILNNIEGSEKINLLSWFGWGIPFVFVFGIFSFLLVFYFFIPKEFRKKKIAFEKVHEHHAHYSHEKKALVLSLVSFFFWIVLSALNLFQFKGVFFLTSILGFAWLVVFIFMVFVIPSKDPLSGLKSPILKIKDCYSNLPKKGFIILAAAVLFSSVLVYFGIDKKLSYFISLVLPKEIHPYFLLLFLLTATIFLSEFISNTAAAISFFIITLSVSQTVSFDPLFSLIGISIISTLPAMSPIASPVNALAYGGIKGIKMKKMVVSGFLNNLIAVILVSLFCYFVLPFYYQSF
ncbi:MAG TPA: hypothetical protein DHW82_13115 [Spirochaetia bacterium]|nr:MAG: hypothetical protein A2Y41_05405 [Spirochaetes bacterium GWB1_36_13]HCL57929.1 hypothetical protein [Spirochaetia bacterium]